MNVRLTTLSIALLAGMASAAPSWKTLTPSMTSMADFFVSPDGLAVSNYHVFVNNNISGQTFYLQLFAKQ